MNRGNDKLSNTVPVTANRWLVIRRSGGTGEIITQTCDMYEIQLVQGKVVAQTLDNLM